MGMSEIVLENSKVYQYYLKSGQSFFFSEPIENLKKKKKSQPLKLQSFSANFQPGTHFYSTYNPRTNQVYTGSADRPLAIPAILLAQLYLFFIIFKYNWLGFKPSSI